MHCDHRIERPRQRGLMLVVLLVAATASEARESIVVGEPAWGDSKAVVRELETLPLHHELALELAYFDDSVPLVPGGRKYLFEAGALDRVEYVARRFYRDSSTEDPLVDFELVKAWLSELFGAAVSERWLWDGVEGEEDAARLAEAVREGVLEISAHYQRGGTRAEAKLFGTGGRVRVRAVFAPTEPGSRGDGP